MGPIRGKSSAASPFNPDQDPTQIMGNGQVTRAVGAEPHDEELIQCPIERSRMRKLLQQGKELLNVHTDQFDTSVRHQLVKKALTDAYQPKGIAVTNLPLAAERSKVNDTLIEWSGMNTILGEYTNAKDANGRNRFKLLTECLVVKFEADGSAPETIKSAHVVLRKTLLDELRANDANPDPNDKIPIPLNDLEPQIGIPYSPTYPFHTQFHRDSFSYGNVGAQIDQRVVVDIRYFCMLELQESNRISFATEDRFGRPNTDIYGMPQPTFYFKTTAKDDQLAHRMMKEMCEAANILGSYLPSALPQFIPLGIHTIVAYAIQGAEDVLQFSKEYRLIGRNQLL
ncbi:pyranose 2-oxidase, putative, partial [Rhizoctonia solani AG-3 Rhs1AP]